MRIASRVVSWTGIVGVFTAVMLAAGSAAWCGDADFNGYQYPFWRIAKLAKPPVIDGVINDDEYASCPIITGMITYWGAGGQGLVARVQDVTWRVGYDDKYLYISMRSPHPKGTWPMAKAKRDDDGIILWDDHTEIQIATQGRKNFAKPGKGFYKIMNNAKGARSDEWFYNGTVGTETFWSICGENKSTVTDERWDMEMSVSLEAMREKKIDGKTWVMQLLRADAPGGVYFAGWVGEAWMSWEKFGEVLFDPSSPVFRFLDAGETAKGDMGLVFEMVGTGKEPQDVSISVKCLDAQGKQLYDKTQAVTVAKDERKQLKFEGKVPWGEKMNSLLISATTTRMNDDTGAKETVPLYKERIPVILLNDLEWKARIEPWLSRKPKSGGFEWSFAYWPYYGIGQAKLDTDFFGMPEEIRKAKSFEIQILPEGGGAAVAKNTAPIENLAGKMEVQTGELKDGAYIARIQLLDEAGKPTAEPKETKFLRKKYQFERNTIGVKDQVLPPFTALTVEEKDGKMTVKPCGREMTIGADGMPSAIKAGGGAGMEEILTGPVRLEAEAGGKTFAVENAKLAKKSANDAKVVFSSEGTLNGAKFAAESFMEFDGWIETTLKLSPSGGAAAKFDRLTLVMPLWSRADTMYVQRDADTVSGSNKMGDIPAGEGVVWDSSKLLPCNNSWVTKDWKTFAPILYAGDGDKGLWWFSDENEDWTSNDKLPTVQYVRTKQGLEMRVNIFAAPATVDRELTFHFAFLADPVKKMPNERKEQWGWKGLYNSGRYAHCTFGWREWGRSCDGYYLEEEDRTALRLVLQNRHKIGKNTGSDCLQRAGQNGDRIVLYGSTSNMSDDLPEFNTFGGEWRGKSYIQDNAKAAKSAEFNIGGSYERLLEREQHEIGCNWAQSQLDCFVWYHEKLLRETPVNGTWWDNGSTFVVTDYDTSRKKFMGKWNVFVRRQLMKRLNTVGWDVGRVPWWINNMHTDWSFNQVSWHIENDYYVFGPTNSILDQMDLGQFRASTRLKRGIIHRLASTYQGGEPSSIEDTRRRARNTMGLCLLHDIGAYRWSDEYSREYKDFPAMLDELVGYFDENELCPFTGYWRSAQFVKIDTPDIVASIYKGKNRAVLVVMNTSREVRNAKITVLPTLLGREPARLYDGESKTEFARLWEKVGEKYVQKAGEFFPGSFYLEGHGVRFIVVE